MQLARINTTNIPLINSDAPPPRPAHWLGRCRQRARQVIAEGVVAAKPVAQAATPPD
jgi:hypothetical protein